MTLEQLRIFATVAQHQHMTKGAQALNLAQSAASHAIAALEARYGTRLFDRVGRRIALTEAGQALLVDAQAILAQVERTEGALRAFGRLDRGVLTVRASQTIASYWLPRHLVAFHRIYPGIEVRLAIGNTAEVVEAIGTGATELGFVEGMVEGEHFESASIAQDQLVVVVGPEHPWAAGAKLKLANLVDSDWVLRERGSGTRSVFEAAVAQLGLDPARLRVAMELPSNEAVRAAVEAGLGASALSASVAAPGLEAGLLRQASFKLPPREFRVVRHRHRAPSRVAEALLATIEKTGRTRLSFGNAPAGRPRTGRGK